VGDEVRSILLGLGDYAILPETEVLLLAAGRAQHVREVIEPALVRGAWVLCDRYVDSTYAYQGGGRELDLGPIREIQAYATGGLEPDVRVLLDLPVEAGLARRHADPESVNRIDLDSIAFHQRVRSMYRQLAGEQPERWVVVDAMEPIESVEQSIWNNLQVALTANGIS
jgi:dTMP kinase